MAVALQPTAMFRIGPERGEDVVGRSAMLGWMVVALVLVGLSFGWAADRRDETVLTVEVSSAEHEVEEGYFALGNNATVMAKPGSDLHRFLTRHRGRTVRIVLSQEDNRELSRLRRDR